MNAIDKVLVLRKEFEDDLKWYQENDSEEVPFIQDKIDLIDLIIHIIKDEEKA
jgi:hypothetical protein